MLRKIERNSSEYDFAKRELSVIVKAYLDKWTAVTGIRYGRFIIRDMKTRWGVCNVKTGRLTFNLQLYFRSRAEVELVVLHELAHMAYPGHGKDFKDFLTAKMPGWRTVAKGLRVL